MLVGKLCANARCTLGLLLAGAMECMIAIRIEHTFINVLQEHGTSPADSNNPRFIFRRKSSVINNVLALVVRHEWCQGRLRCLVPRQVRQLED